MDFDKDTAYKVGYFLPELLGADKVLVGHDCRVSSPEIHDYLVKGITDAGADVYDLGLSTTPMVYFGTANYGFEASVQITASHNPAEYNGMKVSSANALPVGLDNGLGQIRTWIEEGRACPPAERKGQVYLKDIRKDYLDFLMKYKGDYSDLKIAMDLSNGMSTLFAKEIFGTAPAYIFDEMDGRFPNHEPNPLMPDNTLMLRKYVVENKCDIGVIYDGDADRVMFVDEKGRFVSPDLMIALLGHFFMQGIGTSPAAVSRKGMSESSRPGEVIALQDIRSSKAVAEYLAPLGVEVRTWRVGRAYAAPKLRELDGLFGGELAGHYYFKDFFYSDSGIMASSIVLDIVAEMKRRGRTFSSLVDAIGTYFNSGEINFRISRKREAMDAVRDYFVSREKPSASMDFDGYRVEFSGWWFNIRPSNTEPYLRFICEATDKGVLEDRVARTRDIVGKFE